MGKVTDDMTRLRAEVDVLRGARGALMRDLAAGARDLTTAVAAMRAGFASAHAAMTRKTGEEREAFVANVMQGVNSLLDTFSRDRNDSARNGRRDRGVYLSEMSKQVMGMCKETADDLMGARLAWRGRSPGKPRPDPMRKEPAIAKPVYPPVAAPLKKAAAAGIKTVKPPGPIKAPLKKEEKKKMASAPEAPAVGTPRAKARPAVGDSMAFQKGKAKSGPDERPAKTATTAKRGRK